jgi:hypothetical protein
VHADALAREVAQLIAVRLDCVVVGDIVGHAVNRSDGQARVAQPSFSCSCS